MASTYTLIPNVIIDLAPLMTDAELRVALGWLREIHHAETSTERRAALSREVDRLIAEAGKRYRGGN